MNELRLSHLTSSLLLLSFMCPAIAISEPAFARAQEIRIADRSQILFACRADRLYKLPRADPDHGVQARRVINEYIWLTVDIDSRATTLHVRPAGEAARAYVLKDVEQGNSLGSGAGGRADTTIRGKSEDRVFTLFAEYGDEGGADQNAALQISGRHIVVLACNRGEYRAPSVRLAPSGTLRIFTLAGNGFAREMKDLPVAPRAAFMP